MTLKVMDAASVIRTATRLGVWNGTALVSFKRLKIMDADGVTLRTIGSFTRPLAATISPSPVTKTTIGSSGDSVTTNLVTCTPTGGFGPYSYAWTVTAYSAATPPTIAAPTNASTTFTQSAVDISETATLRCTVTDSEGTVFPVSVSATFNILQI